MQYSIELIEKYLEAYSLDDILELNQFSEADALLFLVNEGFLQLPTPEPL